MEDKIICHDCKRELVLNDEYIPYRIGDDMEFAKCRVCFESNPELRNFQPVETYSRITGYIRPITQFNPGKLAEYKDRVKYSAELSMSEKCGMCKKKKCSCK